MFPRIRKGSLLCGGFHWKKILKKRWDNWKSIPQLKAKFVRVWNKKKKNSFEIHVIILRYIRNVNLPFKKDFKFAELLTKISFFLYFRDRSKNQKYAQELLNMHQKRWRKLKVSELSMSIWIDYGLFWLYIYIHERYSLAYLIPIPMFSAFMFFLLQHLVQEY